ncbi:polyprenyl synthetase family protein [Aureibacter tunicatorum]|uniref:Geranylgeranyl diphosphate synthase type II n=1 Tax=Aureibacter tunicatorum TaxID=866807 RepID=A0AAE3XKK5_9BACT|nr:polyprenyl synthetase family protein [Aureibacter tunicatorum]MDR6238338.1 geranylgeranyl diphosphate synthase type II [Aureibacter tunicatorum]BDD03370.1 isoprenyl synthetase [Aureibacter tunicatorum]
MSEVLELKPGVEIKEAIFQINEEIEKLKFGENPVELYDPIHYFMKLGGKRSRPLLALMSYSLFKEDYKSIMLPAIGLEIFHNFTLIHDDIMDKAPLRRGKETVHQKWNDNIAILSGDVMMIKVYDFFLGVEDPSKISRVISRFNRTAVEVCEGQQKDMNFESLPTVSETEYLEMIRQKTAVLIGYALELGGILSDADEDSIHYLRQFGEDIGTGFQLMDDLLDVYADQSKFGKQVGGDIIENKKTFLLINALNKANPAQREELDKWIAAKDFDKDEKVKAVVEIYNLLGIKELTERKMNEYFDRSFDSLSKISASDEAKEPLLRFAKYLISRDK